jgi:hypothetical protein
LSKIGQQARIIEKVNATIREFLNQSRGHLPKHSSSLRDRFNWQPTALQVLAKLLRLPNVREHGRQAPILARFSNVRFYSGKIDSSLAEQPRHESRLPYLKSD